MNRSKNVAVGTVLGFACCLLVLGLAVVGCAPPAESPTTGEQADQIDSPTTDGPAVAEPEHVTVRMTSFYLQMDDTGASKFYTVVQPGQLVYIRSISGNTIKLGFDNGAFENVESPIELPGDGKPFELTINPNATNGTVYETWIEDSDSDPDHGSPKLIVRTGVIGGESF